MCRRIKRRRQLVFDGHARLSHPRRIHEKEREIRAISERAHRTSKTICIRQRGSCDRRRESLFIFANYCTLTVSTVGSQMTTAAAAAAGMSSGDLRGSIPLVASSLTHSNRDTDNRPRKKNTTINSLSFSFSFTRSFVSISRSLVAPKSDAKDVYTREKRTVARIVL